MQKTTHGFLTKMQSRRARSRQMVAGGLILAVCGLSSINLHAKPMTETAVASRTIRVDDAGVMLQVRNGDSLRDIAQYYSRKHNIPFQKTFDLLIQANQSQLPGGDPNRMQVGAQILLPNLNKKASGAAATPSVEAPPASVAEPAKADVAASAITAASGAPVVAGGGKAAENSTVTVAEQAKTTAPQINSTNSAEKVAPQSGDSIAQSKSWLMGLPKSLWALLVPALLLCLGVAYLMRRPRGDSGHAVPTVSDADVSINQIEQEAAVSPMNEGHVFAPSAFTAKDVSSENVDLWFDSTRKATETHAADTVESITEKTSEPVVAEVAAKPVIQSVTANVAKVPESQTKFVSEQPFVKQEPVLAQVENVSEPVSVQSALLKSNSVETQEQSENAVTDSSVQAKNSIVIDSVTENTLVNEEATEVLPEAAEEIQHRFKQALHGLTADQLDLRQVPVNKTTDTAQPIMPTAASTASLAATSAGAASRLNINHLLRQYADHTLDKADQVNYYALAERTRLQKWMSTQSEDDLLSHAQKAYGEGYPNVAHHILNEVLLRGNAAQSTHALDLHNQWHIQTLRQNAQQNRGN